MRSSTSTIKSSGFRLPRFSSWTLALLSIALSGCSTLLFFPTRYLYVDPAKMDLKFDEVRFKSGDGTQLYGWHFHHKQPKGRASPPQALIVFSHGNAQNLSAHFLNLTFVLDHGYDYFIFDYRGYGPSEGTSPNPREAVEDTMAALRWGRKKAQELGVPLITFSQSIGSALSIRAMVELKEEFRPDLIVLDCPFLSFQWAATSVMASHWLTTPFQPLAFLLISDEWAPRRRIAELAPAPILIFHGENDRAIRIQYGEETFRAAGEPKEMVRVPNTGHIQTFWGPERAPYREKLIRRMDEIVAQAKPRK